MNKRIMKQAVAVVAVVELLVGSLSQVSTAQAYTHSTIAVESTMKGVSATSPFCVRYADGTVTPLSDGKVIKLTNNANFADIILKDGASNQYTSVNIGGVDYTQDELCILEEYDECLFTVTDDIRTLTLSALAIDGATCTFTITIDASALASDTPDSSNNSTDSEDSEDSEDSSNDSWYDSDDEDAPTISGVSDEAFYNKTKTITFEDEIGIKSVIINGKEYITAIAKIKTVTVSQEGEYKVEATDVDGNTRTLTFVIDKTAPTISGVSNGKRYSSKRKVSFEDKLSGVSTARYSLSGAPSLETYVGKKNWDIHETVHKNANNKSNATLRNNTTIYLNGNYSIVVTDRAGNTAKVSFSMKDTTKPSFKLVSLSGNAKKDGQILGKDFKNKSTQSIKINTPLKTGVFDKDEIEWVKAGYGSKKYPTKTTNLLYSSENVVGGYTPWGMSFKYDPQYTHNNVSTLYADGAEGYYLIQIKAKSGTVSTYKFRLTQTKKFKNSTAGKHSKKGLKESLGQGKITKVAYK